MIQDSTAAIEVLLPAGTAAPAVGDRVALDGTVVRAYGAPRLRASAIRPGGAAGIPNPSPLSGTPAAALEWRLVRVGGVVAELHRLGDRWRAELTVGGARIPISGLSGARIPPTALAEGRRATVTGIVRRPYPGATDRRFAIVPRTAADIDLGRAIPKAGAAPRAPRTPGNAGNAGNAGGAATAVPDVDIRDLAAHVNRRVRIGGLVADLLPDGARLDDGTGVGRLVLTGSAAAYAPLLEQGDALNATGEVVRKAGQFAVEVADAAGLARVGDVAPNSPAPEATPGDVPASASVANDARLAATAGPLGSLGFPGAAGLASLLLVSVASAAVTVLRRRRLRLRLVAAASRLGTIRRRLPPGAAPDTLPEPTGPPPM